MLIDIECTLLRVESREYDFEGRKGVATKAYILHNGQVFPCKITSELYESLKDFGPEQKGAAKLELVARREVVSLYLVDFQ